MKNRKLIFIGYLCILLIFSMGFIYKFDASEKGYSKTDYNNENKDYKTTENNDVYEESFKAGKNLSFVDIYFNLEDVKYSAGKYKLEVFNGNKVVFKDTIVYKLVSNGKYRIKFSNTSKGDRITIKLSYSGKTTDFSPITGDGFLTHQNLYKCADKYKCIYIFVIIINIIMIFMYKFIMSDKERKIENKFLVLAIPIFIAFLLVNPMFLGHDERFHFYRVFEITEGGALPEIEGETGYHMPSAVYTKIGWGERHYSDIIDALHEKIDRNDISFISDVTMSVYSPIQYTPQVIGVFFAKLITLRPVLIAYIGRFFNLMFCILILYFTLKITPYGKNLFLLFAFIPISIEGFTTLSGDGLTISIAYLFISYILSMKDRKSKKILKRDFPILIGLGIILAFCKLVYIPIIGLLLLIPKKYFKNIKKKMLVIIPLMFVLLMLNLIWLKLASPYLKVYTGGVSDYQINYIFHNLISYLCMFIDSLMSQFIILTKEAFGDSLLWGSASQNYSVVCFMLLVTAIIVCVNDESLKKKFNFSEVLIMILICIMIIGLIFTSLFIQWTGYGSKSIAGVQGRYFSPFIPLIFIIIGNFISKSRKIDESKLTRLVLFVSILASYASLIEMFIKFV